MNDAEFQTLKYIKSFWKIAQSKDHSLIILTLTFSDI